ncbi:MAG TPA: hypothetical protein VLF91_02915 [Candidatus Saccharimonadales bacterium]|nr:hypothetical protein [Candidatus Saccharimonadales bacterium]
MINLLPPTTKENYRYARRNTTLLHWLVGIAIGVAGIGLVVGGGWIFLHQTVQAYRANNSSTSSQLRAQNVTQVQKNVEDISNNLKLVVKVLSREVLFSQLLTQIGSALPNGAVLTGLNITQTTGGIDLDAAAKDYQTASQIQINLADPSNKIFSKADLESIQCQPGGTGLAAIYPCSVQIRAQFAPNNSFTFIRQGGS